MYEAYHDHVGFCLLLPFQRRVYIYASRWTSAANLGKNLYGLFQTTNFSRVEPNVRSTLQASGTIL